MNFRYFDALAGAGKTHALVHHADRLAQAGEPVLFVQTAVIAPATCPFQFKYLELLKMFDPSWLQCAPYCGGLNPAIADDKSLPCLLISSPAADGSSCWLSQALVVSPCFIFSLLQTLRDQLGAWADLVGKAPFAHVRDQVSCFLQGSADHAGLQAPTIWIVLRMLTADRQPQFVSQLVVRDALSLLLISF